MGIKGQGGVRNKPIFLIAGLIMRSKNIFTFKLAEVKDMKGKKVKIFLLGLSTLTAFFMTAFDFSKQSIPVDEIMSGGPPKDGIPSLTDPKFVSAGEANFLDDKDIVLGIAIGGKSKAYPVNILSWHEAVNDRIAGSAILVSW
jgi:hypothetical protein